MKKYFKYIVGGITFFVTMMLFDYLFKFNIDLKVNIFATIFYILLNVLCDCFLEKKK